MKTHVITGANSGIGFEAVRALARQGERVIMAVRDLSRGEAARAKVLAEVPGAALALERVDLLDLDSVRALAERLVSVDVLINNAGLGTMPLVLTKERVYSQFGANHLGHFLLTALLWPKLEAGRDARVVTVTSGFGKKGVLDLDNLDGSRGYGQGRAYMQSKLANALFGAELDRRLRARRGGEERAGAPRRRRHRDAEEAARDDGRHREAGARVRLVADARRSPHHRRGDARFHREW